MKFLDSSIILYNLRKCRYSLDKIMGKLRVRFILHYGNTSGTIKKLSRSIYCFIHKFFSWKQTCVTNHALIFLNLTFFSFSLAFFSSNISLFPVTSVYRWREIWIYILTYNIYILWMKTIEYLKKNYDVIWKKNIVMSAWSCQDWFFDQSCNLGNRHFL